MSGDTENQPMKQTALYVGDLHPSVSDAFLFQKFGEIGPVFHARVCRDLISRESLGYGYVNFRDPKDAETALEHLNYSVICGRPIRLMWSQRDPTVRKSGKGNVFIKNLDKSIVPVELYDTFDQFGKILSCKIAMDDKGISRGYGFIHFVEEGSAEEAINFINGKDLKGRKVYVGRFIPKSERKASENANRFNNCYVKNFGDEMDDDELRNLFVKYGEIKSACVMRDDKNISKGFGFVCFADPVNAEAAVRELNGYEIKDKTLYVGRAQRKEERQEELKQRFEKQRTERQLRYCPGVNLYVKNIDDLIDDESLTAAFKTYGEITSAKVMRDQNNQSRGFGFVCFRNAENAAVAVTNMNSFMLRNKPLYVAIAQRKEDRKAKLTAEYQARIDQMRTNMYPMHTSLSYLQSGGFTPNQRLYPGTIFSSRPRWNQQLMPAAMGAGASHLGYSMGVPAQASGPQTATGYANMQLRHQTALGRNPPQTGMTQPPNMVANVRQQQQQQQNLKQMAGISATSGIQPRMNVAAVANAAPNAMTRPMHGALAATGPQAVRYHQNARNISAMPQQQTAIRQQPAEEAKQKYGQKLFGFIQTHYPTMNNPAKLTGVLLSMGIKELNGIMENEEILRNKIEEADRLLMEHRGQTEIGDADKNSDIKKA